MELTSSEEEAEEEGAEDRSRGQKGHGGREGQKGRGHGGREGQKGRGRGQEGCGGRGRGDDTAGDETERPRKQHDFSNYKRLIGRAVRREMEAQFEKERKK